MAFPTPSTFVPPFSQTLPYQPVPPYIQSHPTEWPSLPPPDHPVDDSYAEETLPSPPTHTPSLAPESQPLLPMRLAPRKGRGKRKASGSKKRGKAIRTPALPPRSPRSSRRGAREETPEDEYPLLQLKNTRGTLLPAPPGSRLEVNDLLILHPPKLSPDANVGPINQYTSSNATADTYASGGGGAVGIGEGYMSRFEMYTCRLCSKTYDGKNARSVARRHLQDKHGVPLAMQKRRSRWDFEPERPKTAEMKAKTLLSKRQWAAKNRQQTRLERTFAVYLAQFGPSGLVTPCGLRLVAPEMRGAPTPMTSRRRPFPNNQLGWGQLPADLIEGIKTLRALEHGSDSTRFEAMDEGDDGAGEAGPSRHFSTSTRTPISDTRSFQPDAEEGENAPRWNPQWHASATHVDDHALQAAIAQHLASTGDSSAIVLQDPSQAVSYPYPPQAPQDGWYYTDQQPEHQPSESDYSDVEDEKVDPEIGTVTSWQGPPQVVPSYGFWQAQDGSMPYVPYTLHHATIQPIPADQYQPYVLSGQYFAPQQPQFEGQEEEVHNAQLAVIEEEAQQEHVEEEPFPEEGMDIDRGEPDVPVEAVAAETLLEIHSTPARPSTHIPSSILRHLSDDTPARPSPLKQSTSDPLTLGRSLASSVFKRSESDSRLFFPSPLRSTVPKSKLLDAPEIKEVSRPRAVRAMSLIAKVASAVKSETMSRSLSFGAALQGGLDDPFAMSPTKVSKKRRSTIASPSPLIKRKKDEDLPTFTRHHSQQIFREQENLKLQDNVKSGIKDDSAGPVLALGPDIPSSPPIRLPLQVLKNRQEVFSTPSRLNSPAKSPARPDIAPGSVSRGWLFSSPGNGETAASLGLAPQWFGVGYGVYGTPGLRGLVSAETPVEKSVKRPNRRTAMSVMEEEQMDESE